MNSRNNRKTRKIHVLLPEDLHREIRIRCAFEDISIQHYVSSLVAHDMKQYEFTRKEHQSGSSAQQDQV